MLKDYEKENTLSSFFSSFFQEWLPIVAMKQAAFHALAEFYQSVAAQKSKSYGEQIARLRVSVENFFPCKEMIWTNLEIDK